MTCQIPAITSQTIIGYVLDKNSQKDTPVRFRDLTKMTDYHRTYTFNIAKEHEPVTNIGISIHTATLCGGKMREIAGTFTCGIIDKLVLKYFDENVWVNCREYKPEEKWKVFGYFMTDFVRKRLGDKLWNDNCLYYWSDVAVTLQ